MKNQDRKEKIINYLKEFGKIQSQEVQALTGVHRNTAFKDLQELLAQGVVLASGKGKGTSYQLVAHTVFDPKVIDNFFSKKEKNQYDRYFKEANRKPIFFNRTQLTALNANFKVAKEFNSKILSLKTIVLDHKKTITLNEQKRKKEKLVIDLAWASSRIEGNTYSLLETENLIKYQETAHGKKYFEAKMILNHKQALEYIRDNKHFKTIDKKSLYELHQILTEGLDVQTGLRKHLVRISNSSYVPCDNEFQIIETLDKIIQQINQTPSVFSKAIMANLLIAYLQPFSDGNKRTSRMLGNAILISHDLLPISFSHTSKDDYIKAILLFYEKQNPNYFKKLFFNELNQSFIEYVA